MAASAASMASHGRGRQPPRDQPRCGGDETRRHRRRMTSGPCRAAQSADDGGIPRTGSRPCAHPARRQPRPRHPGRLRQFPAVPVPPTSARCWPTRPAARPTANATCATARTRYWRWRASSAGDTVADILSGGGYYAEILSGIVGPRGKVLLVNNPGYEAFGRRAWPNGWPATACPTSPTSAGPPRRWAWRGRARRRGDRDVLPRPVLGRRKGRLAEGRCRPVPRPGGARAQARRRAAGGRPQREGRHRQRRCADPAPHRGAVRDRRFPQARAGLGKPPSRSCATRPTTAARTCSTRRSAARPTASCTWHTASPDARDAPHRIG